MDGGYEGTGGSPGAMDADPPTPDGGPATGGNAGTGGAGGEPATGGAGGTHSTGGTGGTPSTGGAGGNEPIDVGVIDQAPPPVDLGAIDVGAPNADPEAMLYGSVMPAPANTNLTSVGRLDWIHFGFDGEPGSVNRKSQGTPLVTMKKIGARTLAHYANRPVTHSWNNGTPTSSGSNVADGVVMGDQEDVGFEIQAVGSSARPRTLTVHVGGWQARGRLTATLAGVSMSYTHEYYEPTTPGYDRVYRITFQPANNGDKVVVKWIAVDLTHMYGNVTLQAATLTE